MLLNCGVGEDSWESLGLQGDPTSPSERRSVLGVIGRSDVEAETPNTLATWCEELTHWKRPWCWERLKAGGEGDDRVWDGWMASPTPWTWVWANSGVGEGQGSLAWEAPAVHGGAKSQTQLSNLTEHPKCCFKIIKIIGICLGLCGLQYMSPWPLSLVFNQNWFTQNPKPRIVLYLIWDELRL